MTRVTVCVRPRPRGGWEVLVSAAGGRVPCETLDEARRLAINWAVRSPPCELIVYDAYNRVVQHKVVERSSSGSARL